MTEVVGLIESITGFKPSRATIWRWQFNGRLVARRIGGRLYTTEQDVKHMLERDEQRKGISDEIKILKRERDEAREKIAKIMAGLEGCCMTCEPVGVRNKQMEREIAALKVCLNASADQVRAQHIEMETLKAERDEARRWFCQRAEWLDGGDGTQTAREHGWDCFKEDGK